MDLKDLRVKLFCDSGDLQEMEAIKSQGLVSGFTTNPSLCRKAGVADYLAFCRDAVAVAGDMPLSLEVVADDPGELQRQACDLADLGPHVFVKVPIVNSLGHTNIPAIGILVRDGVQVNVTACFTAKHVKAARLALALSERRSYISIFAGRIADTGRCPEPLMGNAAWYVQGTSTEIIWASIREPYSIVQADRCGCQIITVFPEMLRRLDRFGRDLDEFARETSEMFYRDSLAAGYVI